MQALRQFARRYLLADAAPLSAQERRRSVLAAFLGMLLVQGILTVIPGDPRTHQLLAPLGAPSVILFALPHSPLGQPWSSAGGLGLSALVGLLCGLLISPVWLAVATALALAIWLMALLRCIHPPGGAMAVVFASSAAVLNGPGMGTALLNIVAILIAGLVVNGMMPGRRWPQGMAESSGAKPEASRRTGIRHADLQYALAEVDGFLDISEDDLVRVYDLALGHAWQRHEQRSCAEIMSTEVVSVEFGTELNEAWGLLRRHHLKALPVTDRARRVIGMISAEDFLGHVLPDQGQGIGDNIRKLLRPSPTPYSSKPEVVGQIMNETFVVAQAGDSIGRIAALLAARQHPPAIPVVDEDGKLVGILGQSDVLAALYHRQAVAAVRARPVEPA